MNKYRNVKPYELPGKKTDSIRFVSICLSYFSLKKNSSRYIAKQTSDIGSIGIFESSMQSTRISKSVLVEKSLSNRSECACTCVQVCRCTAKEMNCRNLKKNKVCTAIPFHRVETTFIENSCNFVSEVSGSDRRNL